MKLKSNTYDIGKWLVFSFLPSFAVFVGGLGELYGWGNSAVFVATINLVTIFIGSILQVSSQSYYTINPDWRGGRDD